MSNTNRFGISLLSKRRYPDAYNEEVMIDKSTGEILVKTPIGDTISYDYNSRISNHITATKMDANDGGVYGDILSIEFDDEHCPFVMELNTNYLSTPLNIPYPNCDKIMFHIDIDPIIEDRNNYSFKRADISANIILSLMYTDNSISNPGLINYPITELNTLVFNLLDNSLIIRDTTKEIAGIQVQSIEFMTTIESVYGDDSTINDSDFIIGDKYIIPISSDAYVSHIKLTDTKILSVYSNGNNHGAAKILTISGNSIIDTDEFIFNGTNTSNICVNQLTPSRVFLAYNTGNNITVELLTINIVDNTINSVTKAFFSDNTNLEINSITIDNDRVLINYVNGTTLNNIGYSRLITIQDYYTNISIGAEIVFHSDLTNKVSSVSVDLDKVLICYRDESNHNYGTCKLVTINNSTLTVSDSVYIFDISGYDGRLTVNKLTENKVLMLYDYSNTKSGAQIVNIEGSTIYGNSRYELSENDNYYKSSVLVYSNKVIIFYQEYDGSFYYNIAQTLVFNNDTITANSDKYIFDDKNNNTNITAYDISSISLNSTKDRILTIYRDDDNYFNVSAKVITLYDGVGYFNSEHDEFLLNKRKITDVSFTKLNDNKTAMSYLLSVNDSTNYNHAAIQILTIDGSNIEHGSEFLLNNTRTDEISSVRLSDNKILVIYAYRNSSGERFATAKVLTIVNGLVGIVGEGFSFNTDGASNICPIYLSSTKVLVSYVDIGNNNKGTAQILNINNDIISGNTPLVFNDNVTYELSANLLSDSGSNVLISYGDNTSRGYVNILNVDGDNINIIGASYIFNTFSIQKLTSTLLSDNKVILGYLNMGVGNCGTVQVISVNIDTSVSPNIVSYVSGEKFVYCSNTLYEMTSLLRLSSGKVILGYSDHNNGDYGKTHLINISGNNISNGIEFLFNNNETYNIEGLVFSDNNILLIYGIENGQYTNARLLSFGTTSDIITIIDHTELRTVDNYVGLGVPRNIMRLPSGKFILCEETISHSLVFKIFEFDGNILVLNDTYTIVTDGNLSIHADPIFISNNKILTVYSNRTTLCARIITFENDSVTNIGNPCTLDTIEVSYIISMQISEHKILVLYSTGRYLYSQIITFSGDNIISGVRDILYDNTYNIGTNEYYYNVKNLYRISDNTLLFIKYMELANQQWSYPKRIKAFLISYSNDNVSYIDDSIVNLGGYTTSIIAHVFSCTQLNDREFMLFYQEGNSGPCYFKKFRVNENNEIIADPPTMFYNSEGSNFSPVFISENKMLIIYNRGYTSMVSNVITIVDGSVINTTDVPLITNSTSSNYAQYTSNTILEDNRILVTFTRETSGSNSGRLYYTTLSTEDEVIASDNISENIQYPLIENIDDFESCSSSVKIANNKVLLIYNDSDNYDYTTARLFNTNTKTFGMKYAFPNNMIIRNTSAINLSNNRVLVIYTDASNFNYITAQILTINPTSNIVTFNNKYSIDISTSELKSEFIEDNKVLITYKNISGFCESRVLTIADSVINFNTAYPITNDIIDNISLLKIADDKALVTYRDRVTPNTLIMQVITLNETVITPGPEELLSNDNTEYESLALLADNKVLLSYRNNDESGHCTGRILSIEGTSITSGIEQLILNNMITNISSIRMEETNKVLLLYSDKNEYDYGVAHIVEIDSSDVLSTEARFVYNENPTYNTSAVIISGDKLVVEYNGAMQVLNTYVTNDEFLGGTRSIISMDEDNDIEVQMVRLLDNKLLLSNGGYSELLDISPTDVVTSGSAYSFNESYMNAAFISSIKISENKLLAIYQEYNKDYRLAQIYNISTDNTITSGVRTILTGSSSIEDNVNEAILLSDNKVLIVYRNNDNGISVQILNITNTSITGTDILNIDIDFLNLEVIKLSASKVILSYTTSDSNIITQNIQILDIVNDVIEGSIPQTILGNNYDWLISKSLLLTDNKIITIALCRYNEDGIDIVKTVSRIFTVNDSNVIISGNIYDVNNIINNEDLCPTITPLNNIFTITKVSGQKILLTYMKKINNDGVIVNTNIAHILNVSDTVVTPANTETVFSSNSNNISVLEMDNSLFTIHYVTDNNKIYSQLIDASSIDNSLIFTPKCLIDDVVDIKGHLKSELMENNKIVLTYSDNKSLDFNYVFNSVIRSLSINDYNSTSTDIIIQDRFTLTDQTTENIRVISSIQLSDKEIFIIYYNDNDECYARIVTLNSDYDNISNGNRYIIGDINSTNINITKLSTNKLLITYVNYDPIINNHITCRIITINYNKTLTIGNAIVFNNSDYGVPITSPSIIKISTTKLVILYSGLSIIEDVPTYFGAAQVLNLDLTNGTIIAIEKVIFNEYYTENIKSIAINENRIMVLYNSYESGIEIVDTDDVNLYAQLLDISNDTIAVNETKFTINTGSSDKWYDMKDPLLLTGNRILLTYNYELKQNSPIIDSEIYAIYSGGRVLTLNNNQLLIGDEHTLTSNQENIKLVLSNSIVADNKILFHFINQENNNIAQVYNINGDIFIADDKNSLTSSTNYIYNSFNGVLNDDYRYIIYTDSENSMLQILTIFNDNIRLICNSVFVVTNG